MDDLIARVFEALQLDDRERGLWEPALPHLEEALSGGDPARLLEALETAARGVGLTQSGTVVDLLDTLTLVSAALRTELLGSGLPGADDACRRLSGLERLALTRVAAGYAEGLEETIAQLQGEARRVSTLDAATGAIKAEAVVEHLSLEVDRCQRMDLPLGLVEVAVEPRAPDAVWRARGADTAVLHEVGECLRDNLRRYDSVGRTEDGGFLLVLPDVSRLGLAGAAERLRRELAACAGSPQVFVALAHYDFVDASPAEMLAALSRGMGQARTGGEPLSWS